MRCFLGNRKPTTTMREKSKFGQSDPHTGGMDYYAAVKMVQEGNEIEKR